MSKFPIGSFIQSVVNSLHLNSSFTNVSPPSHAAPSHRLMQVFVISELNKQVLLWDRTHFRWELNANKNCENIPDDGLNGSTSLASECLTYNIVLMWIHLNLHGNNYVIVFSYDRHLYNNKLIWTMLGLNVKPCFVYSYSLYHIVNYCSDIIYFKLYF